MSKIEYTNRVYILIVFIETVDLKVKLNNSK